MAFPERFSNLPDYAFPRLRKLLDTHAPGGEPVAMTIGEPRHPMPEFVGPVLAETLQGFAVYPPNDGTPELLAAIGGWLKRRYRVEVGPERLMVLNGTREGLFNAALALVPEQKRGKRPVVLMPNPFYQVYAMAALALGAEPVYVPALASNGFLPDYAGLPREILERTALAYLCSPANPQGSVASRDYWASLMDLAEAHDFRIFADECYSEIWRTAPPAGALEVADATGADPERVFVFHSLSKRSNLPGLRSGFVAGGAGGIERIRQLRAFAGAPLPLPVQRVSERAWSDEAHVEANRALYQEKFRIADAVFSGLQGYMGPEGGFFLWLPVPDGEEAALKLWTETGVRVLPGAYLAREVGGENPGKGYIRVAMVAPKDEMQRGLMRLRDCLYG
ncbi:aminotransferase class I/II-fold pyridoxal phosphate-dependent enzyme [Cereibacter azotoformans]|uniref:Aspartate/methionine/tyrosine aminotransferase n=1 Tax=Cereibacter azotoformans TaxID=43057 RepID=A0A2T5JV25_9RHOB|nr:aminotransferase class I/II-fold pyridoxal phosphate-dependent enzyme [Cereibacter azotoformans]AXQ94726.1 aminotransferase class I/II-fold pyridoxal phosphate-dependent enzyme [Cereibacter sphaeroides]MBO4170417.1 aminotransferase class I/II-fold pyridoxal phosphate-dependent enzyme [Cereibacter azotoformans]PTR14024.1 aspartate/methionine/tyrosine aminotransferase [Cereibacter azotoformans]UIJ30294.1 aminotransferase class I/II-fold pyridoxal phosphate-dependent enzyme [Cereibacter azotofo